jgi:hypothetical protein
MDPAGAKERGQTITLSNRITQTERFGEDDLRTFGLRGDPTAIERSGVFGAPRGLNVQRGLRSDQIGCPACGRGVSWAACR